MFKKKKLQEQEFKIEENHESGDSIMQEEYYADYMDKKLKEENEKEAESIIQQDDDEKALEDKYKSMLTPSNVNSNLAAQSKLPIFGNQIGMFKETEYGKNVKNWIEFMNKFTEFQMLQDDKSGEIYALNTQFMDKAKDKDHSKDVMGISP